MCIRDRNITDVNNTMAYFREDMDYTMYRIAIGTMTYQDIHDMPEEDRPYGWEQIKNPHEMINSTRKVYRQLLKRTSDDGNRRRISWIIHCLDQLEDRVDEIEDNLPYGGYDKNMQLLEMGVYMLTEDIAEQSQEFIYYETLHAVSYTHLDVYKRQGMGCGNARFFPAGNAEKIMEAPRTGRAGMVLV